MSDIEVAPRCPTQNRRNSAPIIIKSIVDGEKGGRHRNFTSLAARLPESPEFPEPPNGVLYSPRSSVSSHRPRLSRLPRVTPSDRSSPRSPRSPKSPTHFRFPRRNVDEFEIFEALNRSASPTELTSLIASKTTASTCSTSSRCRRSTSDLTDLMEESLTERTSLSRLSSPCRSRSRNGSIKGGLAYLASRRNSRDSILSASTQYSCDDIAPLNFAASARSSQRRTSNFLELPDHVRPRVCSLPEKTFNPRSGDELYRLRSFSINKGNVVNCGDSILTRRSRSNTSVNSAGTKNSGLSPGERSPFDGSCCGSSYNNVSESEPDEDIVQDVPKYRVVLLGESGVGKTALVSQFMTSEYMNTYDASLDDEFGEKTVSVLLDGEESDMIFIDHPSSEMSVENCISTYEPHGCIVVYSVVDRTSFKVAEDILNYLWRQNCTHNKAVILVGNKADLARARVISTSEGKSAASTRDCKFIETSSGIQHNVDELLVGILKQCRLKENREKKNKRQGRIQGSKTSLSLTAARGLFHRLCDDKSKSCENLHVL